MAHLRLTVALLSTTALSVSGVSAAASAPKTPRLTFSHEVVVDQQRSGFEPNIAIDDADRWYSAVPNGSSTTHSFISSPPDPGKSFQMIPGQIGVGKPATCPQGGGDTEMQMDSKGDLFFSDLQNLTNLSN